MSFDSLLNKSVVIERASLGAEDEWGQPARTVSDLATVRARLTTRGSQRQGGEEDTTHGGGTISRELLFFMRPTDINNADTIRDGTHRYQVKRVEEMYGDSPLHHLQVVVELIEAAPVA